VVNASPQPGIQSAAFALNLVSSGGRKRGHSSYSRFIIKNVPFSAPVDDIGGGDAVASAVQGIGEAGEEGFGLVVVVEVGIEVVKVNHIHDARCLALK